MEAVKDIFLAFGSSPTKLANATGIPVQTVCDWRTGKPNIPAWRRAAVLDAMRREGKEIAPRVYAYLTQPTRKANEQGE